MSVLAQHASHRAQRPVFNRAIGAHDGTVASQQPNEVGQSVRKGQVVCIVEAMKLMNEIEAEFEGKIEEILVQNGEHVEYGQHLFRLSK